MDFDHFFYKKNLAHSLSVLSGRPRGVILVVNDTPQTSSSPAISAHKVEQLLKWMQQFHEGNWADPSESLLCTLVVGCYTSQLCNSLWVDPPSLPIDNCILSATASPASFFGYIQ